MIQERQKRTRELLEQYRRSGNREIVDEIVRLNLPFISWLVSRLGPPRYHDDFLQEALIAFIKALDTYDLSRTTPFLTYSAFYIRSAVVEWMHRYGSAVRVPRSMVTQSWRIERVRREFENREGKKPTRRELSELTGLSEDSLALREYAQRVRNVLYLDDSWVQVDEEKAGRVEYARLEDEDEADMKPEVKRLLEVLELLKPQERSVLWMRYCDEFDIPDIAQSLGIGENEARRLCRTVLQKCRKLFSELTYKYSEVDFEAELKRLHEAVCS